MDRALPKEVRIGQTLGLCLFAWAVKQRGKSSARAGRLSCSACCWAPRVDPSGLFSASWIVCCSAISCSAALSPYQHSGHPLAPGATPAWPCADPVAAIERLEQGYLHQHYASKPTAQEVSEVSRNILSRVLGADGAAHLVSTRVFSTHIVTARGRGPAAASSTPLLATGMGHAALGNTLSRRLLRLHFQRVVFHSGSQPSPGLALHDFDTAIARCVTTMLPRRCMPAAPFPSC